MTHDDFASASDIQSILAQCRTIAMVGLSDKPERPSCQVAVTLQKAGYKIIPVNPRYSEILGEKSYPDLKAVPHSVDVVCIFRRAEEVGPIVEQAIEVGAKAIWLPEGVINIEAAKKGVAAGLRVVMDRCMRKEYLHIKGS